MESLINQAKEYGRRAAEATHKTHDRAMLDRINKYQRNLEYANESNRGPLANAFRNAYAEESSYYLGR
jgi:hypothetical protein